MSSNWDADGNPIVARADTSPTNNLNSINLLEDCLGMIYQSRKNTLETRRRDYERLQKRRGKQLRAVAREKVVILHEDMDDQIEEEEEKQNSMYDELATQMNEKIVATKEAPGKRREARLKPELFKNTSSPTAKFLSLHATERESTAVSLLNTLKTEVVNWWKANKTKRTDDNYRSDFADYLTDKYLCGQLDRFEATKTITGIRKQASSIIETLASDCMIEDCCYEINEGMVPTGPGNTEINLTDNPNAVSPNKSPQEHKRGEKIINSGLNEVIATKKKAVRDERYGFATGSGASRAGSIGNASADDVGNTVNGVGISSVNSSSGGATSSSSNGSINIKKQVSFHDTTSNARNDTTGSGSNSNCSANNTKEAQEKELLQQKYIEMKQKQAQSQAALREKKEREEEAQKNQQMEQMENNIDTIKQLLGSLNKK